MKWDVFISLYKTHQEEKKNLDKVYIFSYN